MNIQVKCEPQKKFDKAQQHKSDVTGYSNVAGKLLTFTNVLLLSPHQELT